MSTITNLHSPGIYGLMLIIFVVLSLSGCAPAVTERICGTMIGYEERLNIDPEFARSEERLEQEIRAYIENMRRLELMEFRSGKVIIPVVVHVVYNTSSQNISDAQIQSQIDILNEDFRRLNADITNVPTEFTSAVSDARIEFKLAERDPNCNPTNGITRTNTTVSSFDYNPLATTATGRNPVKFTTSGGIDGWPSDQYLNIWVCNLSGSLLGYASFPSDLATRPAEDGVVVDYQSFGNMGTSTAPFHLGRTATHEIGHWLNLRHIWGDDQNLPDVCSGTDFVDDTPNQGIMYTGCPTHPQNSCGSNDMFMNYMDYVNDNCMIMLTNGQSDRMDAVLYTTRSSIVSSQGDVPPPVVTADLYSRDMDDDMGDEPNTVSAYMYRTDDIWVRHTNDGITNQEHQNPRGNEMNHVYVRVRNRGCAVAPSGDVNLYWAKASSGLSWPAPWDGSVTSPALMGNFIGAQATGSVAGSDYTILEFTWDVPNPADYSGFGADRTHFCLLSRIETSPTAPFGMTFPEGSNLGQNVRNNNKIVWKNVTVSEPANGAKFASGLISNYTERANSYRIIFEDGEENISIFDHGRVTAILDDLILETWIQGGMEGDGIAQGEHDNEIVIQKSGAYLDNIRLAANQSGVLDVEFEPHQQVRRTQYGRYIFRLEVVQELADQFVGGQSFTFRVGN